MRHPRGYSLAAQHPFEALPLAEHMRDALHRGVLTGGFCRDHHWRGRGLDRLDGRLAGGLDGRLDGEFADGFDGRLNRELGDGLAGGLAGGLPGGLVGGNFRLGRSGTGLGHGLGRGHHGTHALVPVVHDAVMPQLPRQRLPPGTLDLNAGHDAGRGGGPGREEVKVDGVAHPQRVRDTEPLRHRLEPAMLRAGRQPQVRQQTGQRVAARHPLGDAPLIQLRAGRDRRGRGLPDGGRGVGGPWHTGDQRNRQKRQRADEPARDTVAG